MKWVLVFKREKGEEREEREGVGVEREEEREREGFHGLTLGF